MTFIYPKIGAFISRNPLRYTRVQIQECVDICQEYTSEGSVVVSLTVIWFTCQNTEILKYELKYFQMKLKLFLGV